MPSQDFETKYDVIVTIEALEVQEDVEIGLRNIRGLLRDGGKLVFGRTGSASSDDLNEILRRYFFNGADIMSEISQGGHRSSCMIVATAIDPVATDSLLSISAKIISGYDSVSSQSITSELLRIGTQSGHRMARSEQPIEASTVEQNETCIILDTAENALLLNKNPKAFAGLQNLSGGSENLIWVALRETNSQVAISTKSMIQGAARVIRREKGDVTPLIVFEIDDEINHLNTTDICRHLIRILEKTQSTRPNQVRESEYVYRDGKVLIPRLEIDHKSLRGVGSQDSGLEKLDSVRYHDSKRPLILEVAAPGLLNSLRFIDDQPTNHLEPWELQVSSRAHGINFKDVFIALG